MKIACISDTHGIFLPQIPDDVDLVLHAGDVSRDRDALSWLHTDFAQWAANLKVPVLLTWGNHDFIGSRLRREVLADGLPDNVGIRVDEQVTFEGVKIWFSPWSNLFGDWAFMTTDTGLAQLYQEIPDDTDIVVSHGPPKGYGDRIFWERRFQNVGSQALLNRFLELPQAKVLICGHIHEAAGTYLLPQKPGEVGVRSVINASQVNEAYDPVYNRVPIIEL